MEAVKESILQLTTHVEKVQGYSFVIAFMDMVSTVLRINGKKWNLVLSPQILIDVQCDDIPTAIAFATDEELGFESIDTYAFIEYSRQLSSWSEVPYYVAKEKRYRINDVKSFFDPDEIKSSILANFGVNGRKYPLVGVLRRNDFKDRQLAAAAAVGIPYRFPTTTTTPPPRDHPGSRSRHAVLIVGVDTTSNDPIMHYCEVKGSDGLRWGVNGCSKVGFEVFECVLVPYYE